MGLTNLDEQFVFYASYHHHWLNKLIHIICVWPILWNAFLLAQYAPFQLDFTPLSALTQFHPINFPFVVAILYASIYIIMDRRAGTLGAILVILGLFGGRWFFLNSLETVGYPAWYIGVTVQVVAWVVQFIGHGFFEGRSPALLDNLLQAIVMAPMFVLLEVLFSFGYRKDFQATMWKRVEAEIARLNNSKKHSSKASTKAKKAH